MRQRLFYISLVLIIFSIASGLGLRYAMAIAWTEPSALPPGDNVPAPINVGAGAQTKTGDLTIGGNFSVGGGEVVGAPAGGNMGLGTLNAEKLCVQGNCRDNWPEAVSAFVDEGNVGFGPTAVLGTNDNVPLAFETNGITRALIGAAGNLGVGTTNTAYNLMVGGASPRIYLLPTPGTNPELDFGSSAMDTHWAIYRDVASDQLRFWRTDNKLILTKEGDMGVGKNPAYKLDVAGQINANTNLTPAIQGVSSAVSGRGIYGAATDANGTNYGGYFQASGTNGKGVFGEATSGAGINYGVHGKTSSTTPFARGIYGEATGAGNVMGVFGEATNNGAVTNIGGYFTASGTLGIGVFGSAPNHGGYFQAGGPGGRAVYGEAAAADGWGGYFWGGQGVYAEAEVVGAAAGGYMGKGTLNAEKVCIQGSCLAAWPAGVAPGGGDGQLQFNDGGVFSGDAGLTFDKVADVLTLGGNLKIGMGAAGNDDYIYFDDGSKYIKWEEMMGRFYTNSAIFSEGQLSGSSVNAYGGGTLQTTDATNTKGIVFRHDGATGILFTDSSIPGVNAGNLIIRADAEYPANYVEIADELRVNSTLTVIGNATVSGKNVCLQDGTNCPGAAAAVQLQAVTPGVAQVGHLNISGTGIFSGLKIGALNGVLKAVGGVVSADAVLGTASGGTGSSDVPVAGGVAYGTGAKYALTAAGVAGQFLKSQGAGAPVWADIPSGFDGSGTANYLAKFTAGTTLGNSQIQDDGVNVTISGMLGLGWSPIYKLDVNGSSYLGGAVTITGDITANNNTPSGCAWTAYAASVICPNGQFVAGVRYNASTVSAYCCEL